MKVVNIDEDLCIIVIAREIGSVDKNVLPKVFQSTILKLLIFMVQIRIIICFKNTYWVRFRFEGS